MRPDEMPQSTSKEKILAVEGERAMATGDDLT
jgi:hypothetical protein